MTYDILLWGLRTGLVVSGLIGLVLLLRRPFAKYLGAEATFLLWSLPFLRFLMPDIYVSAEQNQLTSPVQYLPFDPAAELYFIPGAITNSVAPTVQGGANLAINIPMTIVAIWVLGAIMWLAYHTRQHLKYSRHLRAFGTPASEQVYSILRRAAALTKTNTLPQILIAPVSIGPMVSGLFRPFIILPKDFGTLYSEQDQLFALTHELSHLKRRDMWWALAMFIFRVVNWYNPLVHYAARKFRIDQEAACDARTLSCFQSEKSSAHGYALTLLHAENTIPQISRMSDPLTLGMGHPVTERIRRLTMRKSNLLTRGGTAALILATLGVTAPVFSEAAAEPVVEAVVEVAVELETPSIEKPAETIKPVEPETATPKAPVIKKLAEAQTRPAKRTGLSPMRLRFTPRFTNEQIAIIESHRQSVVGGNKEAMKDLDDSAAKMNFMNRYQVSISRGGEGVVEISKGNGGWPGYPKINVDWIKRPLSSEMQAGLKSLLSRCAASKAPVYYMATTIQGDADIGKGTFEVECVPGVESKRSQYNKIDLAEAFLASEDIPLDKRHSTFAWKMPFALFETYVVTTPNATIADDRAECVRIYTLMKTKYGFTENNIARADYQLGQCPEKDYNWVRKRENMPLAQ